MVSLFREVFDLFCRRGAVQTVLILLMVFNSVVFASIEERIRDDPDLSEFYALLEHTESANNTINWRQVTVFAPTNRAFQRYPGLKASIHYHISTVAATLDQLGQVLSSDYDGNPPLYITKKRINNQDQIFINNAMVIRKRSNIVSINRNNKKQVLHIIDDVLQPIVLKSSASPEIQATYPDAFQFLAYSENIDIGDIRLRTFRSRVNMMNRQHLYQAPGANTYFIPIEDGFKAINRPDRIDRRVIDGHVIPDRAIFTAPAPLNEPLTTAAFEENLKVLITFFTQSDGKHVRTYVKSQTVGGDSVHTQGVVLGEIVKANIPVKNGVVHLIHRPLVIVDTTVIQFLESYKEKEDGPLFKFWEVINDFGSEYVNRMRNLNDLTIFAPSNEAWMEANLNNIIRDRQRMAEILNLHIVRDRLNTDKIKHNNLNQITQVQTAADRRYLYFNILTGRDRNQTVTLEGGGVNATILQADIAATNGYVHIIDKVLGVPYSTVLEKLKTDQMLKYTYRMGVKTGFNERLSDRTRRFTYFVPRDKAWQNSENIYPSALRKLISEDYSHETNMVLGRHLLVGDKAFSMAELRYFQNETAELPTINGMLRIRVKEEDKRHKWDYSVHSRKIGYSILFNNRWIQVHRPDVECTNGMIHVIDFPFLDDDDTVVSGVQSLAVFKHLLFVAFFAKLLL